MESERFDRLSRLLAGRPSRRRLLGALAAGAVGVLPAAPEGEARRRSKHQGSRSCRPVERACQSHRDCCAGATCQGRVCACPTGRGRCGNGCIAVTPEGNCAAGNACDPEETRDTCSGTSTCDGVVDGRAVCCGVSDVHRCGRYGDAFCCTGKCGEPDGDGVRRCA